MQEVVDEGDAALVFTQFREMGHLLESLITRRLNVPVLFLHGGTPAKERDVMIEKFQAGRSGNPTSDKNAKAFPSCARRRIRRLWHGSCRRRPSLSSPARRRAGFET